MTGNVALSVLIPAWDEERAIGSVVRDVLSSCDRAGVTAECLVAVDSRTTDRTADVARDAGARTIYQQSRGLTAAVLEMVPVAAGPVCVVMDGDGQHDGTVVSTLADRVLTGECDLAIGAREPNSLRSGFRRGLRGTVRYLGARLLAHVACGALRQNVPDPLAGMFACGRQQLLALPDRSRIAPPGGYKLLLGLLSVVPAARVTHQIVPFHPRLGGTSKLGVRIVATTLRQLLALQPNRRSAK